MLTNISNILFPIILLWINFAFSHKFIDEQQQHHNQLTNSTLYTLCRNSDLYELLDTIVNYEARFNHKFHYDWVFLNDLPFDEEFKLLVSNAVSGTAKFGLISEEMWSIPQTVDFKLMHENMEKALNDPEGVYPYADSKSYRNMCRFESGFFQWHEILLDYDYFWRVEPGVKLHCDINYDIFKYLIDNEIDYGFTISMLEYPKTIPSLFQSFIQSLDDLKMSTLLTSTENYSKFIFNMDNSDYNLCHFWTNFEIGNLNTFRSDEYNLIFKELDKYNGFYYERWGDAPIRTLILSTILKYPKIQRLKNIGYEHAQYLQCPLDLETRVQNRCSCDIDLDITYEYVSCSWFFDEIVEELKQQNKLSNLL
ncbi:hypothetical protein DAPK24_000720 [Pichia kluyveri]|uniref:Mannosyltransferase n=1 Tax=Pichia kluyveri TaxID=36015 RepID=A0AAV5QXG5_PICKL|nr:hypothetical protein DAPK24_000720 [Pichia kluyveri]